MAKLSPFDLLMLPDEEQMVFRCLSRSPRLTAPEIAARTHIAVDALETVLARMVANSYVVEQLRQGERTFAVRFTEPRKRVRNLAGSILGLFDPSPDTFLLEMELTRDLGDTEREQLLAASETRKVEAEEIFLWQGKEFAYIGVVRDGLLRRSRITGNRGVSQGKGYVRQHEWLGIDETLADIPSADTYSAVTETTLLVWPRAFFLEFMAHVPGIGVRIEQYLSHQLQKCRRSHQTGRGNLWVIESLESNDSPATVATTLAELLADNHNADVAPRVLVWTVRPPTTLTPRTSAFHDGIEDTGHGYHRLSFFHSLDYSPQTQIDIALTTLQEQYDYIIVDSGSDPTHELLQRVRGRAATLLTLTEDADPESGIGRWKHSQPYSHPAQKRCLLLNSATLPDGPLNPAFYLALPMGADDETVRTQYQTGVRELFRRLSLTHTIGIFIPSTLDVDQTVDNQAQVHAALELLGGLFGGATRTEAEGAWQSEESGLVVEQVTIVRTFVTKDALDSYLERVIDFALQLKQDMRQESIALDVDHHLVLV